MLYYLETNLIAVVISSILLVQIKRMSSVGETSQIIMSGMLRILIVLCCCDVLAYWCRGRSYLGVQAANTGYFIAMAVGSYMWFLYIYVRMHYVEKLNRVILMTGVPVMVLCLAILLNPVSGLFFTVDEANLYHRGPGLFITWIVEWMYLIAALITNLRACRREKRSYRKRELRGYMVFVIPMAISAVWQMLMYGSTTTQIGFAIALFMAYNNNQKHQVQVDALTGLNNRNAFLNYRDSMANRSKSAEITLMMIDADDFKRINDNYGHLKGDKALTEIADIMKYTTKQFSNQNIILYRYAGDEFLIIGEDMAEEMVNSLLAAILKGIENANVKNHMAGERYTLGLSIGVARGECAVDSDFDELVKAADHAMYEEKRSKKLGR